MYRNRRCLLGQVLGSMSVDPQIRSIFQIIHTVKTGMHGGLKNLVWACFSYSCVGPIYTIDGIINEDVYVKVLRNIMLPYAN